MFPSSSQKSIGFSEKNSQGIIHIFSTLMNNDLANYLVGENMENNAKLKH